MQKKDSQMFPHRIAAPVLALVTACGAPQPYQAVQCTSQADCTGSEWSHCATIINQCSEVDTQGLHSVSIDNVIDKDGVVFFSGYFKPTGTKPTIVWQVQTVEQKTGATSNPLGPGGITGHAKLYGVDSWMTEEIPREKIANDDGVFFTVHLVTNDGWYGADSLRINL